MSVIVTVDVEAEDFTLGGALAAEPDIVVQLERVIPLGSTFIPYLWADSAHVSDIEAALVAEEDIESFTVVDQVDGEALVRIEWREDLDGLLEAMADCRATILQAEGRADTWSFQLRFPDDEDLTGFYRRCIEEGISLDLRSVHHPGLPEDIDLGVGLTDTQYETLRIALEAGYFDVPRRINLVELADRLGISDTAASQRIRRGVSSVLTSTLEPPGGGDEDVEVPDADT